MGCRSLGTLDIVLGNIMVGVCGVFQVVQASEGSEGVELLSLAVVKNGAKVVAGSSDGVLEIYSWKDLCDCSDRWPGGCAVEAACES
jgi:hypothetical protein